jgi:tetratricopeptide (TPR) repeat protein
MWLYNQLGLSLYRQGRYAEGAQVAPRQALPLTNLGVAYQLLGRKEDAVAAFRARIDRAPSALAYLSLRNISFDAGDYCRGAGVLRKGS